MSNNTEQSILLEGVLNFRDMGGYKTHSGKSVKRHLFFSFSKFGEDDRAGPGEVQTARY